ncbi:replication stress response regulator SDE2 [Lontra canadensis]|uniref:replication stress response regulator SDE2 n=1 Tax=Lontra canadensis TaxID=76717 RepID=UPI0013F32CB3|nr:replication stress response regulator SDE2 [Lontra canadensis]
MAEASPLVWVRGPGFGCEAVRCASARCSVRDLIRRHCHDRGVPEDCFFVKCDGSLVDASDEVRHGAVYSLEPRLRGGKGGFGSMLRALGAQIEKTTNREACRDLSGRRLRDVNHEKAMAEWVRQQAEREAEKEQKRLERLQRKLAEPRHCFASPAYQQQCHEMAERLEDSVLKGMQAASSKMVSAEIGESRKRPKPAKTDRGASAGKRKCFWLGMEGLETAEESSSETSDDDWEEGPSTSGTSLHAADNGLDGAKPAARSPHRHPGTGMASVAFRSPEPLPAPGTGSGHSVSPAVCATSGQTSVEGCEDRTVATETEESWEEEGGAEGKESTEEEATEAGLTQEPEPELEPEEAADGARAAEATPGETGGSVPTAGLEGGPSGSTHTGQQTLDLLAFGCAAELEVLGLDRLKCELMALGLKCGGTLQERAARLFSVRGLSRDQIDLALFAKPSKGKKK